MIRQFWNFALRKIGLQKKSRGVITFDFRDNPIVIPPGGSATFSFNMRTGELTREVKPAPTPDQN